MPRKTRLEQLQTKSVSRSKLSILSLQNYTQRRTRSVSCTGKLAMTSRSSATPSITLSGCSARRTRSSRMRSTRWSAKKSARMLSRAYPTLTRRSLTAVSISLATSTHSRCVLVSSSITKLWLARLKLSSIKKLSKRRSTRSLLTVKYKFPNLSQSVRILNS